MINHHQLSAFGLLANREIRRYYGRPDCCVFSVGVCVEVLTHFGIRAEPLRVEAAIFPNNWKHHGVVLGSFGDGTRRPAASPGAWRGHLVTQVEGVYLLDTTFDQVNKGRPYLRAKPLVLDLRETKWFDLDPPSGLSWTGCLEMFDSVVRYTRFPRQNGWRSAGDFRSCRRREVVDMLINLAEPILEMCASDHPVNPRESWVEVMLRCPVPMDDLPPHSRELPRELDL